MNNKNYLNGKKNFVTIYKKSDKEKNNWRLNITWKEVISGIYRWKLRI